MTDLALQEKFLVTHNIEIAKYLSYEDVINACESGSFTNCDNESFWNAWLKFRHPNFVKDSKITYKDTAKYLDFIEEYGIEGALREAIDYPVIFKYLTGLSKDYDVAIDTIFQEYASSDNYDKLRIIIDNKFATDVTVSNIANNQISEHNWKMAKFLLDNIPKEIFFEWGGVSAGQLLRN
jgi:hypothetical protein